MRLWRWQIGEWTRSNSCSFRAWPKLLTTSSRSWTRSIVKISCGWRKPRTTRKRRSGLRRRRPPKTEATPTSLRRLPKRTSRSFQRETISKKMPQIARKSSFELAPPLHTNQKSQVLTPKSPHLYKCAVLSLSFANNLLLTFIENYITHMAYVLSKNQPKNLTTKNPCSLLFLSAIFLYVPFLFAIRTNFIVSLLIHIYIPNPQHHIISTTWNFYL